jgi:hypothetical protein
MKIHFGFAFVLSALAVASGLGCAGRVSGSTGSLDAGSGGSGTSGGGANGGSSPSPIPSASCESTVADAGSASTTNGRVPLYHRASRCCSSQRGPGPAPQPYPADIAAIGANGGVACSSDSQCLNGTNGRCFPFEGLVGPGGCSYDECSTDSDCPSATPCTCRSTPTDNAATVCAPGGNCAVDADCGPGGYCSPSEDSCYGPSPYFCHTAFDTCIDDVDCPPVNGGVPAVTSAACAYDAQAQHWACTQRVCYPP